MAHSLPPTSLLFVVVSELSWSIDLNWAWKRMLILPMLRKVCRRHNIVVRAYYMNSSEKVTTAGNNHIYPPSVNDCMFKRYSSVKGGSQGKAKKRPERTKHVRATINIHNWHSWRIEWVLSTDCFPLSLPPDICAKIISQSDHLSSLIRKALFLFNLSPSLLLCVVSYCVSRASPWLNRLNYRLSLTHIPTNLPLFTTHA